MSTQRSRSYRSIALRAAAAGLLASPLSNLELRKLAQELDLDFLANLQEMLMSISYATNDYREEAYTPQNFEENLVELILERVKARRLSKSQVFNLMVDVDPKIAKSVIQPADILRESIARFVNRADAETSNQLLSRILGGVEQDPYLTGITKNR